MRLTEHACPLCGAPPSTPVGPVYEGTSGFLWRRRAFEERLYRCAEGHVYSVRTEEGRTVGVEGHDSVEDWLTERTGAAPRPGPPGA